MDTMTEYDKIIMEPDTNEDPAKDHEHKPEQDHHSHRKDDDDTEEEDTDLEEKLSRDEQEQKTVQSHPKSITSPQTSHYREDQKVTE